MSKDDYRRHRLYPVVLDFIVQMTFGVVYRLWRSLRILFRPPVSASLLVSHVTRITLLSHTFHLLSFFSVRGHVSHHCNIPGKVMVFIIILVLPLKIISENNYEPSCGEGSPDLFCS